MTSDNEARRRRLAGRLSVGTGASSVVDNDRAPSEHVLDATSMAAFYDSVSDALDATPMGEWSRFLNYGYADSSDDRTVVELPPGTMDRASVKLVLELVGDVDLDGGRILDVGSGRGGTVATVLDHYAPRSVIGIELSRTAVAFCRRSVLDARATFVVGDAQRLPVAAESVDFVTNVESAHCYPEVRRFHAEVRRVLAPGGVFLYTDILPTASLTWRMDHLRSLGFALEVERNITRQVLLACDRIASRRQESFDSASDEVLRDFLAVEGSPTYEAMANGSSTYVIWRFRRS